MSGFYSYKIFLKIKTPGGAGSEPGEEIINYPHILKRFGSACSIIKGMYDIITIGSATRDVFLKSDLFQIVHDPKHLERLGFTSGEAQCFALGGKIEIDKPEFMVGGGAANAAVTFARQGFKTAVIAKVGDDAVGREIAQTLEREKIKMYGVIDKKKGTAWSAILISPSGERTILNYRGASEDLKKNEIPRGIEARCIYIVPGRIEYSTIFPLIKDFKRRGAKIMMDFSKHYLSLGAKGLAPILPWLDAVHINREEAALFTGKKFEDEKAIFKKLHELIGGIVAMTDGPKGVLVSDGKRVYHAGTYKEKKIMDRTGAGDSFGSGFIAALMRRKAGAGGVYKKEDIEYAIKLGSANATSNVETVGAQTGLLRKGEFERDWSRRRFIISEKAL